MFEDSQAKGCGDQLLQINFNKSYGALLSLLQVLMETCASAAFVQEPYVHFGVLPGVLRDFVIFCVAGGGVVPSACVTVKNESAPVLLSDFVSGVFVAVVVALGGRRCLLVSLY